MRNKTSDTVSTVFSYLAIGSLAFLAIGLKDIENYISWIQFSMTMLVAGTAFALLM